MLTPRQLDDIPQRLVELYSEVEDEIIKDMAKRLAKMDFIPSAEWQYKKLIDMGAIHEYIIKKLSQVSGIRERELKRLMKKTGVQAVKGDTSIYRRAGMSTSPVESSPALQAILQNGIENTNGLFENLSRSTAAAAYKQFENALDRAWLNINSGAFSYNEAIRMAVKELTDKGLAAVTYPTGKKDYLDVAVRRATITGINQTALKMQEELAEDMGTDLVEVTAHAGARIGIGIANHSEWQGKVYSRSGTHEKYPSLVEKTGYGTGEGLGGWNCRHSMFPFIEGVSEPTYTQQELDELNAKKYDYNGEKLTEYEATQQQRYIERNIRKYKREYIGMKEAGLSKEAESAAANLSKWQQKQKDFIKQTGMKRQYGRESVVGFGRSEAAKAQSEVLKRPLPKTLKAPDTVLQHTLGDQHIKGIIPKQVLIEKVRVIAGSGTSTELRYANKLVDKYGGELLQWQKKGGIIYGKHCRYDVHWNELSGRQYDTKLKGEKLK